MSALIVDLKDFGVRTPEQVLRVFYMLYDADAVKGQLFQIFRAYTTSNRVDENCRSPDTATVAELFDHLIALTAALEQLQKGMTGTCVICGRSPTDDAPLAG